MNNNYYDNKDLIKKDRYSGLLPNRNGNSDIIKRHNSVDLSNSHKLMNENNYRRFDSSNPQNLTGKNYPRNTLSLDSETIAEKITQDFDDFYKKYTNFLLHKEIFINCWRIGDKIIKRKNVSQKVRTIQEKTGYLLLCLLNFSPENFKNYENEIPNIMKIVSLDVRIWYFFEISKYFFQFFSNIISDEAKLRFKRVWNEGTFLLESDVVQRKSVKSDVAMQLLLILNASNPELLYKININVRDKIDEISKYVIKDDIETTKQADYGFAFMHDKFSYIIIRANNISDNSKGIIEQYSINNLSVRTRFKIFNYTNFFSFFFLVIAIVFAIVF